MKGVIAVAMGKGGTGKTTTALNLGSGLGRKGRQVLLVDLDPQGSLTRTFLPERPRRGAYAVLRGDVPLLEAIVPTSEERVRLLPADEGLRSLDGSVYSDIELPFALRDALEGYEADYVLIDTPPGGGLLTTMALVAAERVLLPLRASPYDLEQVDTTYQEIAKVSRRMNKSLKPLGFVITQYDGRLHVRTDVEAELRRAYGDLVLATRIRQNVRLEEAPSAGKSIFSYDPRSNGAEDYEALTEEVLRCLAPAQQSAR